LQKWLSNGAEVLNGLSSEDVVNLKNTEPQEALLKTLGMSWRPKSDAFFNQIPNIDLSLCTKRNVLSDLAKVFDPL